MAKSAQAKSKLKKKKRASSKKSSQLHGPFHPWRLCPIGEHWVRAHNKVSSKGTPFIRSGHCRENRTGKDQLYRHEIENIAEQFFPALSGPPANIPLDPNLVKALIATESGFDPSSDTKRKGPGRARGLMQLTDATRKILQDEKGELFEHLLSLTDDDAYDPNLNIAAGIRWLFHKRYLASVKYKRPINWLEAALEYKDMLRSPRNAHERKKFPEVRQVLIEMTDTMNREKP